VNTCQRIHPVRGKGTQFEYSGHGGRGSRIMAIITNIPFMAPLGVKRA